MLQAMRENASSWIIKILLLAIVVAFVFMGLGSYSARQASKVATVNGHTITIDDFRETYNNLLQRARQQFGSNLNDEILKMMNLKQQAMNQLITRTLILQEAEKLHLIVSDEELTRTIQEMQFFRQNGSFNIDVYEKMLKRAGMTPEQFEIDQRNQMLTQKLQMFIASNIHASEAEAREWFEWENAEVNINAVQFNPADYSDIAPTEEEVKSYYDQNKNNYKTDPKVKVQYLKFSPESYTKDIQVTQEEIQDFYDSNQTSYAVEKMVEARHILIKVDEDAPEELADEARQEADRLAREARKPKTDFSELAKKYSQGPSKDKGGDLGKFARNDMVAPFSDKAFSMNPGEISDPVRTRYGWHVIKVENVYPATTRTLPEVEAEIRKTLIDEKARNIAYDEAESFFDAALDGDDLAQEAEARNLKVTETDFFTRAKGPAGVDDPIKFASAAFEMPEKEVSDILELRNNYYLMQVSGKIPQQVAEFQTVVETVTRDLTNKMKDEKASREAAALLAELKGENRLADIGAQKGFKVIETGYFKRTDQIPQIGHEQSVSKAAFELSQGKKWPSAVLKGKGKYFVIEFIDRKKPDPNTFADLKEEIIERLSMQKKRSTFEAWLAKAKTDSDIIIEENFQE